MQIPRQETVPYYKIERLSSPSSLMTEITKPEDMLRNQNVIHYCFKSFIPNEFIPAFETELSSIKSPIINDNTISTMEIHRDLFFKDMVEYDVIVHTTPKKCYTVKSKITNKRRGKPTIFLPEDFNYGE